MLTWSNNCPSGIPIKKKTKQLSTSDTRLLLFICSPWLMFQNELQAKQDWTFPLKSTEQSYSEGGSQPCLSPCEVNWHECFLAPWEKSSSCSIYPFCASGVLMHCILFVIQKWPPFPSSWTCWLHCSHQAHLICFFCQSSFLAAQSCICILHVRQYCIDVFHITDIWLLISIKTWLHVFLHLGTFSIRD